ncbi:beta-xylosidase [Caballeronia sp. LZ035]|uniref:beta-xylosidase n=1 Tax=Caballeronia sp. LZ035 TaxID=3038568 RepID=UPI002858B01A|nr:beta-xylosidase [Caballeronia sp. LZ035]MDR5762280.1 beta-xylosidase [Caballeronia sp. LZ035]
MSSLSHERFVRIVVASLIAAFSTYGLAQITQGAGAQRQENRQSDSSTHGASESAGSPVVESNKPQSKEAAQGRRATSGKQQKPEGNTGFGNGLYGTGAGNNK